MKPHRRRRLFGIVFVLVGAGAAIGFLLAALDENIDLFYPPDQVVSGEAPVDERMRAGGMVLEGSVERGPDLEVRFVLTDYRGSRFEVRYAGILPDLFREGQGILATGRLGGDGVFRAEQVLAKHDEKYMPPELAGMAEAPEGRGGDG